MSGPADRRADGAADRAVPPTHGGAIDGVLFDVDDTLVDTRAAFVRAMQGIARQYLPHLGPERDDEVLAVWRRDSGGHYRAYTRGELTLAEQRLLRANELQAVFGGPVVEPADFGAWDEVFEASFQAGWSAHDDAAEALRALRALGVRVGALSNAATAYQELKLARVGLGSVPLLVGVDTLGVGKPDPRVFLEACARLGTAPDRTVYVGDELDVDALGAAAAGLVGVWLDRPGARRGGDHLEDPAAAGAAGVAVLRSLAGLPAVVADL